MVMGKGQFFTLLLVLLICPFMIYLLSGTSGTEGELPISLWGPVLVYALWPLCSLLVLFLIPDSLDSPIPRGSKIFIGIRPIIAVVNDD